jgi:hypothetical protein
VKFTESCFDSKAIGEGPVAKTCRLWLPLSDYAAKHGKTLLPPFDAPRLNSRADAPLRFSARPLIRATRAAKPNAPLRFTALEFPGERGTSFAGVARPLRRRSA